MHGRFAGAAHTEVAEFRCTSCGHTANALVVGAGEGAQSFLNPAGTAERRAAEDAVADVQRTLSVARCPSCGQRDAAAVRRWWLRRLGPVLAVLALISAMGLVPLVFDINMSESDKWMACWATQGIALVVGIPFLLIEGPMRWSGVDGRIVFEPDEAEDTAGP